MSVSAPELCNLELWDLVVVTHNSAADLRSAWSSVPSELRARVVCVDNGSTDDTVSVATSLFGQVVPSKNFGLSVGNNRGAAIGSAPYIMYLNPDVTPSIGDFSKLRDHLDTHGGLVSPRLIGTDLEPQDNARGWPVLRAQIQNRLPGVAGRSDYIAPVELGVDSPVPWVLGAAIASKREDIARIGGWPEEYFLYYEDVELCIRAWQTDMPVWLLGSISWQHSWARASRSWRSLASRLHAKSAARFFWSNPAFVTHVPRGLATALSQAKQNVATEGSGQNLVDFVLRSDARSKGGGDVIQANQYAKDLGALGFDVRVIEFNVDLSYRPGALVHLFNIDRPYEVLYSAGRAKEHRVVISTIHHEHTLTRRMHRADADGVLRTVAGLIPQSLRESLLFARRVITQRCKVSMFRSARVAISAVAASPFLRRRVRKTLLRADAILLLSHRELAALETDYGYVGKNFDVIPNGIPTSVSSVSEWNARDRRIVVAGRIEPRKRQLDVVREANELGVPITFVGPANDNHPRYVAQFFEQINEGGSEWLGGVSHRRLLELMGSSRVLLNFSWVEVQSLVDLEGAVLGCHIVTSASGATAEWLPEVVNEFSSASIRDAIRRAEALRVSDCAPAALSYQSTWAQAAQSIARIYDGKTSHETAE